VPRGSSTSSPWGDIADQKWTGKAIEPAVTVKDGKDALKAGTDYTVKYADNVDAGTATATITFAGDYKGFEAMTVKFTIVKKETPTEAPSTEPTTKPSTEPSTKPMTKPTAKPTAAPTAKPEAKADYTLLGQLTVSGSGKTALKLTWTKVKEADGYDVFFARCGKDFKLKATVSAFESRRVRFTGLKKRESYKAYVRAWQRVNGRKVYIGRKSPEVHAITGGYDKDYCNTRSVKLSRSKLTLKVGKSKAIRATLKGVKSGKKLLDHVHKVRWYSSNVNVATIDRNGKVKATGKGSCTVYAIANNGVRNSVKVTVK